MTLTVGSLFAGIGGFDLGFERAGMITRWQVEQAPQCLELLAEKWPGAWRWRRVQSFLDVYSPEQDRVDLICGGDPCPAHSTARRNKPSAHPDLSGYFLAVVGRLRPRWLVRENVPSPSIRDFDCALAALGYGTVVIRMDAAEFTRQSRVRDFIVGCLDTDRSVLREAFPECETGKGPFKTRLATEQKAACLVTNRTTHSTNDNYVWEPERGLRILDSREREALAGFPEGWTEGFSDTTRAHFYGNAVVPQVAEFIGRQIMKAESETR